MKRSILLSLAIIPMLFACNKNNNGFENPFPEDEYEVKGMDYQDDRAIVRTLSTDDRKLVEDWIKDRKDEKITYHEIVSQVRDYTLAFANKYKAGYHASNAMVENVSKIYKTSTTPSSEGADPIEYYVTKKTSNATYQYDFGENEVKDLDSYDFHCYAEDDEDESLEEDIIKIVNRDDEKEVGQYFVNIPNYQTPKNDDPTNYPDAIKIEERKGEESWDTDPSLLIPTSQKDFVLDPSSISDLAGFDNNGRVVLVNVDQSPYGDDGYYKLPDGRKYKALQKELIVTKLGLVEDTDKETGEPIKYYLINYVRTYKEVSITSEEVQPNIPPTELSKPIIIHYEEDIHRFSNSESDKPSKEFPSVPLQARLLEDKKL